MMRLHYSLFLPLQIYYYGYKNFFAIANIIAPKQIQQLPATFGNFRQLSATFIRRGYIFSGTAWQLPATSGKSSYIKLYRKQIKFYGYNNKIANANKFMRLQKPNTKAVYSIAPQVSFKSEVIYLKISRRH